MRRKLRPKYIVRHPDGGTFGVCGLRWDSRQGELLIGGPRKFLSFMEELAGHFQPEKGSIDAQTGGTAWTLRFLINNLTAHKWRQGIVWVSRHYALEKVRGFRRLTG